MPDSPVEQVREGVDIVDLVSQYVTLKKSGRNFKGLCPFHGEKTPSFYVFPDSGHFHCFGCGEGGDVFSFLMKSENMSFSEALRRLADRIGVVVTTNREPAERKEANQRTYAANEAAAVYFHGLLMNSPNVRRYVVQRGVTDDTIREFLLGYASDSYDALQRTLVGQGFTPDELLAAGLLRKPEEGSLRDWYRSRWMFPIRDADGRIVSFGGRALAPDQQPKYMNGPQTDVFDKGNTLFALHAAAAAIRKEKRAVVVEGYVDAVVAHQAGFHNVVATLGTAITDRHLRQLSRHAPEICLALDPDAAGQNAVLRSAEVAAASLSRATMTVAVLPDGKDPDELILEDPNRWVEAMASARPVIDHALDWVGTHYDFTNPQEKLKAADAVGPLLKAIADPIQQADYFERAAQRLRTTAEALRAHLRLSEPRRGTSHALKSETVAAKPSDVFPAEQVYALGLAVVAIQRGLPRLPLDPEDFTHPAARDLAHRIKEVAHFEARSDWRPDVLELIDAPWLDALIGEIRAQSADMERLGESAIQESGSSTLRRLRLQRLSAEISESLSCLDEEDTESKRAILAAVSEKVRERRTLEERNEGLPRGAASVGRGVPVVPPKVRLLPGSPGSL